MNNKPIIFVITPFGVDFLALYDDLKKTYENEFEFTNGGDLDNQQNILQDIVEGIYNADVIIADLTGQNPNVFYELGLAHAMNKKVIIITQDLSELPFDIRSYRANEYSLQFNRLPKFKEELTKLLKGAVDNTVKYGNPVSDYIPRLDDVDIHQLSSLKEAAPFHNKTVEVEAEDDEGEKGFIDFIADIQEHSEQMITEIKSLGEELSEVNESIESTTNEMNKGKNGNVDAVFARKLCRKMSGPVDAFANKLEVHVDNISMHWTLVENSYLSLLDNPFTQTEINRNSLKESIIALQGMQDSIQDSDEQVECFVEPLRKCLGIERKLTKAINTLIAQLENYLTMIDTMVSSIDRIVSKSEIVISS